MEGSGVGCGSGYVQITTEPDADPGGQNIYRSYRSGCGYGTMQKTQNSEIRSSDELNTISEKPLKSSGFRFRNRGSSCTGVLKSINGGYK
jgi:hypothetical protein